MLDPDELPDDPLELPELDPLELPELDPLELLPESSAPLSTPPSSPPSAAVDPSSELPLEDPDEPEEADEVYDPDELDEPDEPDEETSSLTSLDVASVTAPPLPLLLVPPGGTRSVGPPLAHAAPMIIRDRTPDTALAWKYAPGLIHSMTYSLSSSPSMPSPVPRA